MGSPGQRADIQQGGEGAGRRPVAGQSPEPSLPPEPRGRASGSRNRAQRAGLSDLPGKRSAVRERVRTLPPRVPLRPLHSCRERGTRTSNRGGAARGRGVESRIPQARSRFPRTSARTDWQLHCPCPERSGRACCPPLLSVRPGLGPPGETTGGGSPVEPLPSPQPRRRAETQHLCAQSAPGPRSCGNKGEERRLRARRRRDCRLSARSVLLPGKTRRPPPGPLSPPLHCFPRSGQLGRQRPVPRPHSSGPQLPRRPRPARASGRGR